ncbi:MAG: hypothetical protein ACKVQC_03225 [Elusimicrobiota bacterium]
MEKSSTWPANYWKISEVIFEISKKFRSRYLLSTSFLHPRHSIPVEHLEILAFLKDPHKKIISNFSFIKALLVLILNSMLDFIFVIFLKIRFWRSFCQCSQTYQVIVKTWVPHPDSLKSESDFYFGNFLNNLNLNKKKSVFLAGDARPNPPTLKGIFNYFSRNWEFILESSDLRFKKYIPEKLLVPVWAPIVDVFGLMFAGIKFFCLSILDKDPLMKIILKQLSLSCLKVSTFRNAQYFWIGMNVSKKFKVSSLVTLFEGQPWEKIIWLGAKSENSHLMISGYQHTVVMSHAFALLKPIENAWFVSVPDLVMCTGPSTVLSMQDGFNLQKVKFISYGTHRRGKEKDALVFPRPQAEVVLVLPEGILSEAIELFNLSISLAKKNPNLRFIFRCHPVLPFDKVQPFLTQRISDISQIELSKTPVIKDDFLRASLLLYRGSSSALYSVLYGLKPICTIHKGEPNIDPMSSLRVWREYASNESEVLKIIENFKNSNSLELNHNWQEAAQFVDNYFCPVSDESFKKVFDNLI